MTLLYGIGAAALLWWLMNAFARSDSQAVAKAVKVVGGIVALGAAVLLGLRGRLDMALMVGALGAGALGWSGVGLPTGWRRSMGGGTRFSRMRSAMIEMEIDHATGSIEGTVLAGPLAGCQLSGLDPARLRRLHEQCVTLDPEGLGLLEAYLDRRLPGWREDAHGDRDTRTRTHAQAGAMTKEEAYQILGLQPGAGLDQIRQAHRTLMKKLHPDHGGTAYLAARVNQAREVLLGRHR